MLTKFKKVWFGWWYLLFGREFCVLQQDIDLGLRGKAWHCPVAKCLQRSLGVYVPQTDSPRLECSDLCVTGSQIRVFDERFDTPKQVRQFISDFDLFGKEQVKPFCFRLKGRFLKAIYW